MKVLIDKIEQAFADVEYPGDDDLTSSTYGEEPAALVEDFRGKTDWRDIAVAFLNQAPDGWGTALAFFSARALRFYLPAYMIADVRGELECPDPVSRLCSSVTPLGANQRIAKMWGGGTMGERARAEFAGFNAAQVSAIVAYLWWKLEAIGGQDPTIEQALENYWLERHAETQNGSVPNSC
jgi:hypothetical protein